MTRLFLILSAFLLGGTTIDRAPAAELGHGPSTELIIEGLMPPPPLKLRGIRAEDPVTETTRVSPPQTGELGAHNSPMDVRTSSEPPLPSMDFSVHFEFGSSELTPDARDLLDRLGTALQSSELRKFSFRIVGHTDAVGSDESNLKLSRARAEAAKAYLVRTFQIAPARLETAGFGKSQLIDRANPTSEVNRRVQVVNLGSASRAE